MNTCDLFEGNIVYDFYSVNMLSALHYATSKMTTRKEAFSIFTNIIITKDKRVIMF